ncbi:uncharacterized protein LOC105021291 [Esox lucius]|uniref:G-protein coupled receptors family 3 profile domain-containing protein n=2 Tax=Esox lucius TaxID=8010 RepID=A0AAY5KVI5_ESOLU|nr:uncharacterized protein LOC105021291 [Esox lucius]
MDNQTQSELQTEMSTTMQPFNLTLTSNSPPPSFTYDTIAANDLISRANYVYGFCALLGLASACFLLFGFVQSYRACRGLVWLDTLLWAFSGFQLLLLLLSLSSVAHRPNYLETTELGCAALAFMVNLASLCGLFLLVLMGYTLTYDPPTHTLMKRPGVCVGLVVLISFLCCLVLARLRNSTLITDRTNKCIIDPTKAGSYYAIAKLCLGVLIPFIILLGLLIGSCIRQWKSRSRFLSGSENGPVFLAVAAVLFVCQLFHCTALVRGARMNQTAELSPYEKAFMDLVEFVMFSGSCVCLVLVLLLHRPSRESLLEVMRRIGSCCRGLGGRQTHRHIMAPQIEIADTQSYDF